jgi:hypothetical protein
MALRELWFVLVGVLTTGYFILEGFDYGVGMLHPWLNHTDTERRASLSSIARMMTPYQPLPGKFFVGQRRAAGGKPCLGAKLAYPSPGRTGSLVPTQCI